MSPYRALAVLLVLVACSEGGSDTPRECLATHECRAGERCVEGTCRARGTQACATDTECGTYGTCLDAVCVGGTACRTDGDCGTGESCDAHVGMCRLAKCDAKGGCPNGGACDFATNRCGPRRACTRDSECLSPKGRCDGGYCAPGCALTGCGAGLSCESATGRCGTGPGGCANDAACGAPANVCDGASGECVPGCGTAGCTGGATCDTSTGRCAGGGGCASDAACGAPANVCEGGQCIAGCGTSGCTGGAVCDTSTGRCGGGGGCASDTACGAPANVCEGGQCIPSCITSGCTAGMSCNTTTGRCEQGQVVTETPCTTNLECTSKYCLTPPETTQGYCSEPCGRGADCGAGTRCAEPFEAPGIKACLGQGRVDSFIGPNPGNGSCASGGDCQSGMCCTSRDCGTDQNRCVETCSRDADCGWGSHCRAYMLPGEVLAQSCIADGRMPAQYDEYPSECDSFGFGGGAPPSTLCSSTMCAVGVDPSTGDLGAPYCFRPCCNAMDCGGGSVCIPMNPWFPAGGYQASNVMRGCWPAVPGSKIDPTGSPCALDDGKNCRSNLCVGNTADGAVVATPYCTDYCCSQRDCAAGYQCVAVGIGETTFSTNMCLKLP